jgi:hypothetical protein
MIQKNQIIQNKVINQMVQGIQINRMIQKNQIALKAQINHPEKGAIYPKSQKNQEKVR